MLNKLRQAWEGGKLEKTWNWIWVRKVDIGVWSFILFTWLIGWLVIIPYITDELKKDVDRISLTLGVIGALFIGTVGLLGLYVNYRRTVAFEEQLKYQREHDKERQHQELYVASIRDLSDVGSIYGLEQLAKESEIWAPKIATIFCKYIRSTTSKEDYRKRGNYRDEPSVEVLTMMEVLTVPGNPFDSTQFDLRYAYLVGANLRKAQLAGAKLFGINLAGALLDRANLVRSDLTCADLNLANLNEANLECALLGGTRMIRTNLVGANLSFSEITGGKSGLNLRFTADLRCANLKNANLLGVYLDANLTGANLEGASLIGAFLGGGEFLGASLKNAKLEGCGGVWQGKLGEMQPMKAIKLKIDEKTKFDGIVGPAPIPNLGAQQNINQGIPKTGNLKHQTPGNLEEQWVNEALMLIKRGRLTDLSNVSCGALTQGLYDAIIKDRDSNTTENEKRYRDQNSKELKPGDPDMQKMQTQLVGNDVGKCEWDNLYVWK